MFHRPEVTMYLLIYVDDFILVSSSITAASRLVQNLRSDFAIKDLGSLRYFLGIAVALVSSGLVLTQKKYALDLLSRAGMLQCQPVSTPMTVSEKLNAHDGDLLSPKDATQYRSIVGGLEYILHTRPDLSFAVNIFMPLVAHIGRLLSIFCATSK
jgi:hypothetical protein